MPMYEVDYTYLVPEGNVTTVIADTIDLAEQAALDQLSDTLDPEITELTIEAIKEIRQ